MSEAHEGHNSAAAIPEHPFFQRWVNLERDKEAIVEDIKALKVEIREADLKIGPLGLAVKRYLESEETRLARENKEAEAERILRALGDLADTPLGDAAVRASANGTAKPKRSRGRPRKEKPPTISEALEAAKEHLEGNGNTEPF